MDPQSQQSPQFQPPTLIRSVSEAAVLLALGGRLVRQTVDHNRVLLFEIVPPAGADLNDPDLVVSVPPLLGWMEALSARVRQFNRQRQQGNR
jgi:hypothetical protein